MRGRRGSVLVQVLVMSVLLIILATGLMRLVFMNHMIVAHTSNSDRAKYWIDACLAQKNNVWAGNPCNGAGNDSCNFVPSGGPVVNITCSGVGGNTTFSVTW